MSTLLSTIRDLHRRKARERRALALAEGIRLVEEALAAGVAIKGAAIAPALEGTARGQALKAALTARSVPLEVVTDAELVGLADTEHPQGVVAVASPRVWSLADIHVTPGHPVLVLDGVQDPGNVGTIARTALALGAAGLVALPGTADLLNPKALRGSMGALFRLPAVHAADAECLDWLTAGGVALWVTDANGEDIRRIGPPTAPVALVLGNEGAGIRADLLAAGMRRVSIPIAQEAESLNVAVAAGILLHEVTRGR
ncbi:MAG TPA: RNA methyltransferase [Gemmatimonadales bacterium]|nr:RNA methyltransferase [Gemmatimonadales bacterium]